MKEQVIRKFTGKLDGFKNKEEKHFFDRMLRAYLKGKSHFNYGRDAFKNPVEWEVQQTLAKA